jgi:hypothetical protein
MPDHSEKAVEAVLSLKHNARRTTLQVQMDLEAARPHIEAEAITELAECIFTEKQISEASTDDVVAALKSRLLYSLVQEAKVPTEEYEESVRVRIEAEVRERLVLALCDTPKLMKLVESESHIVFQQRARAFVDAAFPPQERGSE